MSAYIIRRIIQSVGVILGVSLVVFIFARISGDPAALLLSVYASAEDVARFRALLGLDRPLPIQFWSFLTNAVRGDFGTSFQYHLPALGLVLERMPATIELTVASMLLATILGVPAGIISAVRRHSFLDQVSMTVAMLGQAMPTFWLGILLVLLFAVNLHVLPAAGGGSIRHLILPSVTLGAFSAASIARLTRAAMVEVLMCDYIRTARAKGLTEQTVLVRHALRNAAIPIITVIGLQTGALLGGAVVTETIFAWPGVGSLAIRAVTTRDYPLVQACVFVVAVGFVLINTILDITYLWLNPRIRL
jgi:ABC-type dipeptide/oligopeptide/nickel transport system permease component